MTSTTSATVEVTTNGTTVTVQTMNFQNPPNITLDPNPPGVTRTPPTGGETVTFSNVPAGSYTVRVSDARSSYNVPITIPSNAMFTAP